METYNYQEQLNELQNLDIKFRGLVYLYGVRAAIRKIYAQERAEFPDEELELRAAKYHRLAELVEEAQ